MNSARLSYCLWNKWIKNVFHFLAKPSWQFSPHSPSHTSDHFAFFICEINLTDEPNIAFEVRKPLEHHCITLCDSLGKAKAFSISQDCSKTLIEQKLMWWSFSGEYWKERAFLLLQPVVHSGHHGHVVSWIPSMPCLSESISFHRSSWALSSCVTSSLIHTCFWHLCCSAWSLNSLLNTFHFITIWTIVSPFMPSEFYVRDKICSQCGRKPLPLLPWRAMDNT